MPDHPGSLRLTSTFPFVGRSAELEKLRSLLPLAEGEGGRVVLLGGEPGSGKSRLVRELAAEAANDGVLVLTGACDAVVRTPYGPFVEALDQLARTAEPDELRAALGATGGELTRLLPDLPARIGELTPPVSADPDTERHRLHTTVATLLAGISQGRPVLLILEDGHWADAPTLLLLRYLARAAGGARLLMLVTFRDAEADIPETLAEALADLRRSDSVARMRVAGLLGRGGHRVHPQRRRRGGRRRATVARAGDRRPHRRQPLPGLRAVARPRRDGDGRARRWDGAADALDDGPRDTRERARGRQPAARSPGRRDRRAAGAGGHGRRGVRLRRAPARRWRPGRRAARAPRRGRAQRDDRGAPVASAGLSLRPRAGASGAL